PQIAKNRKELLQKEYARGLVLAPFFEQKAFRRLAADRDIRPELQDAELKLDINGTGATNVIRAYISDSDLITSVITKTLLDALNKIFEPDCTFTEITIQQHKTSGRYSEHEVYLTEETKGSIELSMSGSGLKTVMLVLLNTLVIPKLEQQTLGSRPIKNYIFAFEELENNLHPALLRRLFRYIEDFAKTHKCHFFITTHSSVVIDLFAQSPNAQIVHVTHNGKTATTQTVKSFNECNNILNDLGVRASDLLQANGIVWLEGPSDKIYFNRWINLFSDGELQEHRDYECAFFAGSLLSHFDAKAEDNEAIDILRINRNNILIADSDKTSEEAPLKPRVERMQAAMKKHGGLTWVTQAKEIENYIPAEAFKQAYGIEGDLPEIGIYEEFDKNEEENPGYWQRHRNRKTLDKVQLAKDVEPYLSRELLENRFDLVEEMEKICDKIRKWNTT
ncbi:MAG: AAA family ATPase, partial [Planctomycetia bacterium]